MITEGCLYAAQTRKFFLDQLSDKVIFSIVVSLVFEEKNVESSFDVLTYKQHGHFRCIKNTFTVLWAGKNLTNKIIVRVDGLGGLRRRFRGGDSISSRYPV